tara:strand:+ start:1855 stop:2484 length:630 start_codon:yes stop_codon:yes gene_type:complete
MRVKKKTALVFFLIAFGIVLYLFFATITQAADSNTVSSTVVTDKSVPTASAPSVVVNNNDVCKSAAAASVQTQVLGIATGITITDENCERLKLSRGLYVMGMKVAAVSTLCGDYRIFDAMWMAGTPCPYMGKIGDEAKTAWLGEGMGMIPEDSAIKTNILTTKLEEKKVEKKIKKVKKKKVKPNKRPIDAEKVKLWATPLGILSLLLLL